MNDAIRHYDELLAEHYSWMVGMPFEQKAAEQKALLTELGLGDGKHGAAIDLGSGPGYQAAALADLGFAPVIAIDTSKMLLDELTAHRGARPIDPVLADLRQLARHVPARGVDAITCMGDVLTHLESQQDVSRLLADAFEALAPGGRLVLTFRDMSHALAGLDRFIPVQSDADRVMVCFLEYEPQTVILAAEPGQAAVTVLGGGPGNQCYLAARFNLDPETGISFCNEALLAPLSRLDRAGTHVNRGVMEAAMGREDKALEDFNRAVTENPGLGDGYLNRGAMLVNRKRYVEARADIMHGIALGPSMPEIGYYDLGVLEQALGHSDDARRNFQRALSVAPYFQPAVQALENFTDRPLPVELPA